MTAEFSQPTDKIVGISDEAAAFLSRGLLR
jgi:hypothetical protein